MLPQTDSLLGLTDSRIPFSQCLVLESSVKSNLGCHNRQKRLGLTDSRIACTHARVNIIVTLAISEGSSIIYLFISASVWSIQQCIYINHTEAEINKYIILLPSTDCVANGLIYLLPIGARHGLTNNFMNKTMRGLLQCWNAEHGFLNVRCVFMNKTMRGLLQCWNAEHGFLNVRCAARVPHCEVCWNAEHGFFKPVLQACSLVNTATNIYKFCLCSPISPVRSTGYA